MEEEKVSIIALLNVLFKKRKLVYKVTSVFIAVGILICVITPREYTCTAILLSESSNSSLSGLSGLASLAGVNLGNNVATDNNINPALYEQLLGSTPFVNKIVNKSFSFPSIGKKMLLKDYLFDYSKPPITKTLKKFPTVVAGWFTKKVIVESTADTLQNELLFRSQVLTVKGKNLASIRDLQSRITYTLDMRTGLMELDLDLQDRVASAAILKAIIDELSYYVVNYQTQKERRSLVFTEDQLIKAKKSYTDAQGTLASFRDRNRNILFNIPKAEDDRLQAQVNLEFSVYNSLLQQREQLKLKVANETPAISVMEPPQIPSVAAKPKIFFTILICAFLGFFLSSTYVLFKGAIIKITS